MFITSTAPLYLSQMYPAPQNKRLLDPQQLDIKHQRAITRDPRYRLLPICQLRRDCNSPLPTWLHTCNTNIPTLDNLSLTQRKREWLSLGIRVKHVSVGQLSNVAHVDLLSCLSLRTRTSSFIIDGHTTDFSWAGGGRRSRFFLFLLVLLFGVLLGLFLLLLCGGGGSRPLLEVLCELDPLSVFLLGWGIDWDGLAIVGLCLLSLFLIWLLGSVLSSALLAVLLSLLLGLLLSLPIGLLAGLLVGLLVGLLWSSLLLLLVVGKELLNTGVLEVVEFVPGIGPAVKLILRRSEIVTFAILVIPVTMVMSVTVRKVDVVSSKVNIVISSDLEENILRARDGKGEWLLVVL